MDTLIGDIPPLSAVEGLGEAAAAALTDAMVERLATAISTGLEFWTASTIPIPAPPCIA